jgi:hypothetical protein
MKLKKLIEELKKKNLEKSEALKSIKDFFMSSTVFKLKNVTNLEKKEYKTDS